MRHVRHFITALATFATWCVVAATVTYAREPDPIYDRVPVAPTSTTSAGGVDTPLWKFALVAAIAALLTLAVVGLIVSLRQTRTARPSRVMRA